MVSRMACLTSSSPPTSPQPTLGTWQDKPRQGSSSSSRCHQLHSKAASDMLHRVGWWCGTTVCGALQQ
jgi:hypothetical protein